MAFLDETGLAEVWSLAKGKFTQVATGQYTGTGKYGSGNPNTLTFDFAPKLVIVSRESGISFETINDDTFNHSFVWHEGNTSVSVAGKSGSYIYGKTVTFSRNGTTLSWYCKDGTNDTSMPQCNTSGTVYHYIAIG